MDILVFNTFEKRKNSTKVPDDTTGTTKQVVLKGECSIVNPSFFLGTTELISYIKAWGNYYFVDRIAYDINGAQYINCSIDVLASWKSQILQTKAYISYCSSEYNENVIDNRIATRITVSEEMSSEDAPYTTTPEGGSYIISCFDSIMGVSHYAITTSQMDTLVTWLFNQGQSLWSDLQLQFGDAMGSVIGIRYVPIDRESLYDSDPGYQAVNISLGTCHTDTSGYRIKGYYQDTATLSVPWIYSDFRRTAPYTRFYLVLPFVGTVEINAENIMGAATISIIANCNVVTGSMIYTIRAKGKIIGVYTCEFGRQVATATDQIDATGAVKGGVALLTSAVAGAATGITSPLSAGGYGVSIAAATGAIAGLATATIALNRHDVQTYGGFSGGYGELAITRYYLVTKVLDTQTLPTELTELYGRPLHKVKTIGDLSGYVETLGFDIDISAVSEIKDLINSAMDRGVYIE